MQRLLQYIIIGMTLMLAGCASRDLNSEGNPINRSLLIDHHLGLGLEVPGLPFQLPKINIDFRLNFRRLTPKDEVRLELARKGIDKDAPKKEFKVPEKGPVPAEKTP